MSKFQEIDENTSTSLDVHVSPSLHPDIISTTGPTLADSEGPGQVAYTAARTALKSMYQGLSDIETAHAAMTAPHLGGRKVIEGNVTRHDVPDNRRAEVADAMSQSFTRVAHTIETNNAAIEESILTLGKLVDQSLINPRRNEAATVQNAAEIRQHIRSLPEGRRMDFIQMAIQQADHDVATAVIGASCFTSGLTRDQHQSLRGVATERFAPRETAQLAAARKAYGAVQRGMTTFVQRFQKLLPMVSTTPQDAALRKLRGE